MVHAGLSPLLQLSKEHTILLPANCSNSPNKTLSTVTFHTALVAMVDLSSMPSNTSKHMVLSLRRTIHIRPRMDSAYTIHQRTRSISTTMCIYHQRVPSSSKLLSMFSRFVCLLTLEIQSSCSITEVFWTILTADIALITPSQLSATVPKMARTTPSLEIHGDQPGVKMATSGCPLTLAVMEYVVYSMTVLDHLSSEQIEIIKKILIYKSKNISL